MTFGETSPTYLSALWTISVANPRQRSSAKSVVFSIHCRFIPASNRVQDCKDVPDDSNSVVAVWGELSFAFARQQMRPGDDRCGDWQEGARRYC